MTTEFDGEPQRTRLVRAFAVRSAVGLAVCLAAGAVACGSPPSEVQHASDETWSVTVWGTHFEVFPEIEALVVGETAMAHTHVTRLEDFTPLVDGEVDIVLSGVSGDQIFTADRPLRPGIFAIEIVPTSPGDFELSFRIRPSTSSEDTEDSAASESFEQIHGGRVRVGTTQQPGGLIVAPAPKGTTDVGEPVSFLKEEAWRSDFATAWVRPGRLARSVAGLARVRPPAGGETLVTSPVNGVLQPTPGSSNAWPFVGLRVDRGQTLFQVAPHVAAESSLATLEAQVATLSTQIETARARHSRLEELFDLEATSQREVEESRVRVETLDARLSAASHDLDAARSSRKGGSSEGSLKLRAPFAGKIAQVTTTPGATVAAGEALARLVRTDVIWLEISLSSAGAQEIEKAGLRGVILTDPEHGSIRIEKSLRLVSVAPEISPQTGTVSVLVEAPATPGLILGATLEAQVLSTEEREGLVIPASAVVDDGGVTVVYLQLSGESFGRQEVQVLDRQGEYLLVEGLTAGQRLVSRGGNAIRRSSLMAGGDAHGHVH